MRNFFTYLQKLIDLILPRDQDLVKLREMRPEDAALLFKPNVESPPRYVRALYSYRDPLIKKLVWHMKFKECQWVAELFGEMLAQHISGENFPSKTLLIPVPIHTKRRRERGYNQCEWLCESIIKKCTADFLEYKPNIVTRDIYTVKQSWSDKATRQSNIQNVFLVKDSEKVRGRNVIIIDDVCTTGATLDEMRRTLLAAGALSVRAFVIAH